ncbi:hypothetical protein [Argonema galeatum]|uniref:hypothetical protein n=1 Tax=Argonema galeatum TaxID=2942762 RepID=UPI0020111BE2|nr:hypothetical protein [Argonema galeatum]MCL1467289.1 hypothetical protein [Argonema galeatum A003/A1]
MLLQNVRFEHWHNNPERPMKVESIIWDGILLSQGEFTECNQYAIAAARQLRPKRQRRPESGS